jgi:hypothetical protein
MEDCRDIPAKCKTASNLYAAFTRIAAGNDPAAKGEWAQSLFGAFRPGVEVRFGCCLLERSQILYARIDPGDQIEAKQFTEQDNGQPSTQHRTLYLLDPLHGT